MSCKYYFRQEVAFAFHVSVYFMLIFTNQEPVVISIFATSFTPSSSELIFGLNNDRKNQSSSAIVKKLDFTLLFAKYYLYINKLAPKDLSLDEFKAKISWRYDFEKAPPSIS